MRSWLVVAGKEHIGSEFLSALEGLAEDISILTCHDVEGALVLLQDQAVDLLIASAHDDTVDCLDLIPQAFAADPDLKVAVLSRLTPSLRTLHDLTPCLRFISEPPHPDELASLMNGVRARCPLGHKMGLDAFLAVSLLSHGGTSRAFRLSCSQGQGTLGFVNGILVHAHTAHLEGDNALQQMCLWDDYHLEAVDDERETDHLPNISSSVHELLRNAAALRREFSGYYEEPPVLVEDQPASGGTEQALLTWWQERAAESPGVVRVLFGFSPDSDCRCVETISQQFADALKVRSRWSSSPDDGPSFVRIHTEQKGLLSLTFVPMIQKNEFVFETFANRSDAVVICGVEGPDKGAAWESLVPGARRCLLAKHGGSCRKSGCEALAQLVKEKP